MTDKETAPVEEKVNQTAEVTSPHTLLHWLREAEKLANQKVEAKAAAEAKRVADEAAKIKAKQLDNKNRALALIHERLRMPFVIDESIMFRGTSPVFKIGDFDMTVNGYQYYLNYHAEESSFRNLSDDLDQNMVTLKETMDELRKRHTEREERNAKIKAEREYEEVQDIAEKARQAEKAKKGKPALDIAMLSISAYSLDTVVSWLKVLHRALRGVENVPQPLRLEAQRPIFKGLMDLAACVQDLLDHEDAALLDLDLDGKEM